MDARRSETRFKFVLKLETEIPSNLEDWMKELKLSLNKSEIERQLWFK